MRSLKNDLAYVQQGIEELEEYLLSQVLFWPMTGKKGSPLVGDSAQLTPGNLLLALKRLRGGIDGMDDASAAQELFIKFHGIQTAWRSAWEKKCAQDINARLPLLARTIQELLASPKEHQSSYAYNIRSRAILDLLLAEIPAGDAQQARMGLAALDRRLKAVCHPGEFVWEAALQAEFPKDNFWYLYQKP